jgi:hypothetical protein
LSQVRRPFNGIRDRTHPVSIGGSRLRRSDRTLKASFGDARDSKHSVLCADGGAT